MRKTLDTPSIENARLSNCTYSLLNRYSYIFLSLLFGQCHTAKREWNCSSAAHVPTGRGKPLTGGAGAPTHLLVKRESKRGGPICCAEAGAELRIAWSMRWHHTSHFCI